MVTMPVWIDELRYCLAERDRLKRRGVVAEVDRRRHQFRRIAGQIARRHDAADERVVEREEHRERAHDEHEIDNDLARG